MGMCTAQRVQKSIVESYLQAELNCDQVPDKHHARAIGACLAKANKKRQGAPIHLLHAALD
jgi:hypothetical protein